MENNELEMIKKEIEEVREQINIYIQYPEIFEDELTEASKQIDILINYNIKLRCNYDNICYFKRMQDKYKKL